VLASYKDSHTTLDLHSHFLSMLLSVYYLVFVLCLLWLSCVDAGKWTTRVGPSKNGGSWRDKVRNDRKNEGGNQGRGKQAGGDSRSSPGNRPARPDKIGRSDL
jgi:hypothetical protein